MFLVVGVKVVFGFLPFKLVLVVIINELTLALFFVHRNHHYRNVYVSNTGRSTQAALSWTDLKEIRTTIDH